ncbi:MAG: hypothetical protein OSA97_20820 [Nevskia sp.]|nr:hypothetical protein [Nevskia sp.]
MRVFRVLLYVLFFAGGFGCGAASFVRTQARPLPALHQCESLDGCAADPEVLGLITSVGLHLAPGLAPEIVARSRECVGIRNPKPADRDDLVFFPTRDMRNLLDVAPGDEPYLLGCLALMRTVVEQRHMASWRIVSNGPGIQEINYLHFHLTPN